MSLAELPYNDYFEYYGPDFKLHISPSNMTNQNTPDYLDKIKSRLFENLRMLPHAPGVQMQGKTSTASLIFFTLPSEGQMIVLSCLKTVADTIFDFFDLQLYIKFRLDNFVILEKMTCV